MRRWPVVSLGAASLLLFAISFAHPVAGSAQSTGKAQGQTVQPASSKDRGQAAQKKPSTVIKSEPSKTGRQYYPSDPAMLRLIVQRLLSAAGGDKAQGKILGLISPDHGYLSSGVVAAAGYKQLPPSIKTVFILGPSRQRDFSGASIPAVQSCQTPLGAVPLSGIAEKLRRQKGFTPATEVQTHEQSIGIQLPFLQQALKQFELVPILVGKADPIKLAQQIIPYLTNDSLIIASSNLSEQHPYDKATALDKKTTQAITSSDFKTLAASEASGRTSIAVLMEIARQKKWSAQLIDYENSGNTTRARKQVAGFASIAFVEGKTQGKK